MYGHVKRGQSMNILVKSDARDLDIAPQKGKILYSFYNGVQIRDISGEELTSGIKTKRDYYSYSIILEKNNKVIAMRTQATIIDVYNLDNMQLLYTSKLMLNHGNGCYREFSSVDKEEKNIYSIIYVDETKMSFITKFSLSTYEEKIILILPNVYAYDICYSNLEDDYLISGIFFNKKQGIFRKVGKYKGIWLESKRECDGFPLVNSYRGHLKKVGIMADGEILYWNYQGMFEGVCNYKNVIVKEKTLQAVAFSKNGKYIACVKRSGCQSELYILSYEGKKIIESMKILDGYIYDLEFRGNDKYMFFKSREKAYLVELMK